MMRVRTIAPTMISVMSLMAGCGDETPADVMGRPDTGATVTDAGYTPGDTGTAVVDGGSPASDAGSPTDAGTVTVPTVETVTGTEMRGSTTWTSDHIYQLPDQALFVMPGATLTIQPGTTVRGQPSSSIVVVRGGRLVADGTRERPIVFTSARPVGTRNRGDWGGIVMLGSASINRAGAGLSGENQIEGIDGTDARGRYGSNTPDDESDCGVLRYVRVEFAGRVLARDNELNGITVGGCGRRTVLDHVQVHRGEDDGIELFGGTVDLRHALITASDDDGLDWDFGWRGRGQFIVVQQTTSTESDPSGIEADNDRDANNAMPRSAPTLYNLTLVGPAGADTMPAMVLRRGTAAQVRNAVIMGWGAGAIDVRDAASATLTQGANPTLFVNGSVFFQNGPSGTNHFALDMGSDGELDENAFFRAMERGNRFDLDPMISNADSPTAPNFAPSAGSPAATGGTAAPSDGFFDPGATFVGAVRPGEATPWTTGWTAYPVN